jgi:hypothetical protein
MKTIDHEYKSEFKEHLATAEGALLFAKALRTAADLSRHKFFLFLFEVEVRKELWSFYAATFASYLQKCHLVRGAGYTEWKEGMALVTEAVAAQLGVPAARELSRVPSAKLRECVQEMSDVRNKEGVTLSHFNARRIASKYSPELHEPRVGEGMTRAELERENAQLKRKVERLETQLATVKAKLAAKRERRGGAPAPAN